MLVLYYIYMNLLKKFPPVFRSNTEQKIKCYTQELQMEKSSTWRRRRQCLDFLICLHYWLPNIARKTSKKCTTITRHQNSNRVIWFEQNEEQEEESIYVYCSRQETITFLHRLVPWHDHSSRPVWRWHDFIRDCLLACCICAISPFR